MSSPPEPRVAADLAFELLKLLLQVAWADDDLAPAEAETLLAYGRKLGLGASKLKVLGNCLAGRQPLPPPNLGLLRTRRTDVLRAVKELMVSDLQLGAEEESILLQISQLLR